jgi:endonuclease III-like uncharacterized protein
MDKFPKIIKILDNQQLINIIDVCSRLDDVNQAVHKNHDDNLWWPLSVDDWRLRMLIAGWSTRISYNMIKTYQKMVNNVTQLGYETLCNMSDSELKEIIGSLGLFDTRKKYFLSLNDFINYSKDFEIMLKTQSNDELISLVANNVKGASYKVAQCAILYAKGYNCGIFPVDSGMKDLLGPCMGIDLPNGLIAHDIMRKQLELQLNHISGDLQKIIIHNGYSDLTIQPNSTPIWWAHLVLIYFKRFYCNKKFPSHCPLRAHSDTKNRMGKMCDSTNPEPGGIRYLILEGPDQVGKSTLALELGKLGYSVIHSSYNPNHTDIYQYYYELIQNTDYPTVFDRSFISEIAYGKAIRNYSRFSDSDIMNLLHLARNKGLVMIYLKDDIDSIRKRLLKSESTHAIVLEKLPELICEYEKCVTQVKEYIPVIEINCINSERSEILKLVSQAINNVE